MIVASAASLMFGLSVLLQWALEEVASMKEHQHSAASPSDFLLSSLMVVWGALSCYLYITMRNHYVTRDANETTHDDFGDVVVA
mmetsp:Transcript_63643/g.74002  ORF Transcript_63643/g.74002 Transcript_63643/m.74002 type:complete len:84 (-) Transcript_63643:391-642(-)